MNSTVIPLQRKNARKKIQTTDDNSVVWPVTDLPDEQQCGQWLDEVIAGSPHEGTAVSLWTHHQNLREAAEKLACFITPRWPSAAGESLLQAAVHEAVTRAHQAVEEGQAFEGRLVGVYLYGLLSVVHDVAALVVRGRSRSGVVHRWEYFSQPLLAWAKQNEIEQVVVTKTLVPPSAAMLEGLRTHLLARIADPLDTGYLAKHAPHG